MIQNELLTIFLNKESHLSFKNKINIINENISILKLGNINLDTNNVTIFIVKLLIAFNVFAAYRGENIHDKLTNEQICALNIVTNCIPSDEEVSSAITASLTMAGL